MIELAWPFVALCAVAVLWRGVKLATELLASRNRSYADRGELGKLRYETEKAALALDARVVALEDEVRNLGQRVPSRLAR